MALFGTIETLEKQTNVPAFHHAFAYLKTANLTEIFNQVSPGHNITVELDGRNLFAIFQQYTSKPIELAKPEAHKVYADIQFIFGGAEQIGVADASLITHQAEYNSEKDILLPQVSELSLLKLHAGSAAILFPDDVHAPGIALHAPDEVWKIVFKVKL